MNRITAVLLSLVFTSLFLSGGLFAGGKETFDKSCKSCHGADGRGNPAMATGLKVEPAALDLTDAATKAKAEADLVKVITDGQGGKMPAFGTKLSADEITAVAQHLKGL